MVARDLDIDERIPISERLPGIRRPDSPVDLPPRPSAYAATQSPGVNRPPKPPGDYLGPYFQFLTTKEDRWIGSCLLLRKRNLPGPVFLMECDTDADLGNVDWDVLYEDIFGFTAWRLNLSIEILPIKGDTMVSWKVVWAHEGANDKLETGSFAVAGRDAKWRGGFFSCNGFDATVPEGLAQDLTYTNVWNHLGSVHLKKQLHILIWGGDQNYIDFIFDDVPFLKRWVQMEWEIKWAHEFSDKTKQEVQEYHFNTYCENWERPEVKLALANVPALMSWDDHDIFDGAGSYPPLLHDSPVMLGLFSCAQKFRLLFQHHTTPGKVRQHRLFGDKGHNSIVQCGSRMAILLTDGRTERTPEAIQTSKTWNMIFDRLDNDIAESTEHLLAVFAVPFSFVRFRLAEHLFDIMKNLPNKCRKLPLVKHTNSIFGLPELYDDLLDEWTHTNHIEERNRAIANFQRFAKKHSCRVTFMSGDVHCCGLSRFRTVDSKLAPVEDYRMMYQVISSAIVNMPPSRNILKVYHLFKIKWTPFPETEERFMNFFERMPECGRKLRFRKLMPNRNWCYFEMVGSDTEVNQDPAEYTGQIPSVEKQAADPEAAKKTDFWRLHYPFIKAEPYPSTLGPTSYPNGRGITGERIHIHSRGLFCSHRHHHVTHGKGADGDLRIQLWLESSIKEDKGRRFASYEVVIPPIEFR